MIRRLKIHGELEQRLRTHLLRGTGADEEAAFLLAATARYDGGLDMIVREMIEVPDIAMLEKGRSGLVIDPRLIAGVLKKARLNDLSIFLCHSHPFVQKNVRFSGVDDEGERLLFPRFQQQVPGVPHGAIVYGHRSVDARVWMPDASSAVPMDEILVFGHALAILTPAGSGYQRPRLEVDEATCRQALAIGEVHNRQVSSLCVGLVGAGGVGSVVFDAVARMGVTRIVEVDADQLALTNVSRVIGSGVNDVGKSKTSVLAEYARRIGFGTRVQEIEGWVQSRDAVSALCACDVIVLGTDIMKSRLFVARLGVQFQIPVISVGIDIYPRVNDSEIVGGHVAVQHPGGPCVDCLGLVDHGRLELEEMVPEVRRSNPYVRGRNPDDAVPSIIAFNLVVGGLVAVEILQLATARQRAQGTASYLVFNGGSGEVRRVAAKRVRNCGVCDQVRAWGDRFDLPFESAGGLGHD